MKPIKNLSAQPSPAKPVTATTPQEDPILTSSKEVVVVTGSSGFIGRAIIEKLHPAYRIVGLDKEIYPFPPAVAESLKVDISSRESVAEAMQQVRSKFGGRIASCIHLAAYYDFSGETSPLYKKITVHGTENLLAALQPFEVQQFIFSSSMLVYKPTKPGRKIDENGELAPSWDYPKSKAETEDLIHNQRAGIPAVILRIAGVYNDEGNSIPITNQIQRIYERTITSHLFSGDTSSGNTFVHLDDLVDAVVKTVEKRHQLPPEIVLNIGEERPVSYEQLQHAIGQLVHGEEWKTYEIPKPLAKAGATVQEVFGDPFIKPWMIDKADDHYEMDISRAKMVLDWQPKHSLLQTLPKMIENLKADPSAWYKKNKLTPG